MNGNIATLATRYSGRPLLMLPRAAQELARRIHEIDARAFSRPGRLEAIFRKLSGSAARPMAMEDDEGGPPPPPLHERAAYVPLYIGEAEDLGFCWALKDGVALMQVDTPLLERGESYCGTVYHGYDTLLAGMRDAMADERVKAIFLRAASPGGVVAGGLAALAKFMRENRAAAGGKPIWVYADMACSAMYWVAAQADRIPAPAVGLVASIGAVLVHENYAKALEEFGVEITPIQFGAKKTDGAWWGALSEAARADLQAEIDQCGRNFVADVAAGRAKLTPEALLATEAGVYMGEHDEPARSGLALGFVDEILSEEDAFAQLVEDIRTPSLSPAASNPIANAPAGRAAATSHAKEQPMAGQGPKTAAKLAALSAEKTRITARLAAIDAEEKAGADAPADDKEKEDEEKDKEAGTEETGGEEGASEATAIAASAEAKAEPQMALAAIGSGLTLSQFQAQVKALGNRPKGGALREALANSPRLGPDAVAAGGGKQPVVIDATAIYAGRKSAGRK